MEHTHLVKGLDFALLQKVSQSEGRRSFRQKHLHLILTRTAEWIMWSPWLLCPSSTASLVQDEYFYCLMMFVYHVTYLLSVCILGES